ncbi:BTB/POZ domain protein [Paecilomyces variotii No. 5]|uniref:BTB/POZ domain protein n=1 Tax=Byssochlamys spectabilis (strain No. 5 / NBRC 109023) TaxID=1356009 RepID=V5FWT8_BYSSN|nr:BTB/POZ domain protein [Paecilomyces variotii No. 5]
MDSDSDWSDPDNPRPKKPAPRRTFFQEPKLPKGAMLHMNYCFFHGLLGKLLDDGSYSDFTIRCKDREWKVHKAIVCSQSDMLDAAVNGRFTEAETGVITLSDDEPEIVDYLIHYFYHHTFDDKDAPPHIPPHEQRSERVRLFSGESKADKPVRIPDSLKVYAIADKYMVSTLRVLAHTRFEHWCAVNWHTESFLLCVREIYERKTGNYEDLHDSVLIPMVNKIEDLLHHRQFIELMEDCGELGVELIKKVNEWNRITRHGLEVDNAFLRSQDEVIGEKNKKLKEDNKRLSRSLLSLRSADASAGGRRPSVISSPSAPSLRQPTSQSYPHRRTSSGAQNQMNATIRPGQSLIRASLPIRLSTARPSIQAQAQAQASSSETNEN